jgi:hypothetical protein
MTELDWKKMVTLNPPNEVRFKLHDKDKARFTGPDAENTAGAEFKAIANIQIINKSKTAILFKVRVNIANLMQVKTTQINNYMVRPNAEVIPSQHSLTVKIQTQQAVSKVSTHVLTV